MNTSSIQKHGSETILNFILGMVVGGSITWCVAWYMVQVNLINPLEARLKEPENEHLE